MLRAMAAKDSFPVHESSQPSRPLSLTHLCSGPPNGRRSDNGMYGYSKRIHRKITYLIETVRSRFI